MRSCSSASTERPPSTRSRRRVPTWARIARSTCSSRKRSDTAGDSVVVARSEQPIAGCHLSSARRRLVQLGFDRATAEHAVSTARAHVGTDCPLDVFIKWALRTSSDSVLVARGEQAIAPLLSRALVATQARAARLRCAKAEREVSTACLRGHGLPTRRVHQLGAPKLLVTRSSSPAASRRSRSPGGHALYTNQPASPPGHVAAAPRSSA
jgi:hypothetical protein